MSKDTLSLYLSADLAAAVRGEAERKGVSVSEMAETLLSDAMKEYRAKIRTLERVRVIESLPVSLADVDTDHPIFTRGIRGDGPFEVKISHYS